jgi:WD40 repeat protein/serine/threonine protein kinase/two-component SAPR family response regulator
MSQLLLSLFGQVQTILNGQPLAGFRTQKVLALLIYLAAEPATAHRRERLMTLLWPGMPEASARANLRQILFHLRQAIPDLDTAVPLLIANRHSVQINPQAPVQCDLYQFDALLRSVQGHEHVDLLTCHICYEALVAAVSLYQGDFLAGFYLADSNDFEEWAEVTRQHHRRKVLDALGTLTTLALHRSAYAEARTYAERQLAIDNLHEPAYRQLMEVLALGGQRGAALSLYESCRRLLAEELGMAPGGQTTTLYERIQAGELRFDQPQHPRIRGYELKEEIGAGSYGVIYRAAQPAIGREVAIKVIHPRHANDPAFIRRFEAEAQTIARLEHPHIVPLYDYWRESGGAYLVMRLLRGGNLLARLQDGPWPASAAALFLDQIAAALQTAHQQGIVHRDIKPANILFDEAGNAYLSDFGIARDLNVSRLRAGGGLTSSLDYISPEQLQAEPVTPQSDIYSLGAVLYEVLTGERPFADLSLAEMVQRRLTASFPPVSESMPGLAPAIDEVIQQATATAPGERFPTVLALAGAFRRTVEATPAALPAPPSTLGPVITNPYKGLRPYREADSRDFFGREALIAQLTERLAASRFLAVVGPSGSGKSSVVQAGLIPALRAGALPGSDTWYVAQMVPGTHPLEELELALWPIAVDPPPSLLEPMRRDTRGLLRTIRRILPDAESAQLLLHIDQFEELFTMVDDEARRNHFLESLYVALTALRTPLRVIITLRADFYDRPLQVQPLADLFKQNTELVLPLNRDELLAAVQEPGRRAGVGFEEGLLPAIVADVEAQPGTLPLLQYALTELFENRRGRLLTRQAYGELGGVPGALARRADELFLGLSRGQQAAARQLFLRLVTLGEGVEDTRRRVPLAEINQLGSSVAAGPEGKTGPILDRFGAARLLVFDRDPLTREPTVEVAHEALLQRWGRLRAWIAESRADIRLQRQLDTAAAEWEANGRDDGYLLRGARLSQFTAWQEQSTLSLLPGEEAFLQASLAGRAARQEAEAARQRRELETAQQLATAEKQRAEEQAQAAARLRQRALGLAGALAVAAVLAIAALFFAGRAQQNAMAAASSAAESQSIALAVGAQSAIALAAGAQSALAKSNGDLALALAVAANETASPPAFSRRVLYDVALAPGLARQITAGGGWRWAMDVSPDGDLVASAGDDPVVTIWKLHTGEELLQLAGEHAESVSDVVFTPDGRFLLGSDYSDQLILWDIATGSIVWRALNPTGDPNILSISPDGTLAAAGTEAGVVTLWDMATGELVGQLEGHDPEWQVLPVSFSPDGQLLASGSQNGEIILWDVADQRLQRRIQANDDVLFALAFSPDGNILAAGGKMNVVRFFDVATGAEIGALTGLPDWQFDLDFSPDGTQLLVGSRDSAVMLWDVATQRLVRAFYGEAGFALSVAFADADTAVSGHDTGHLRVWDLVDRRRQWRYASDTVVSAFAQTSGGRLGAAGFDDVVRVIDMEDGELLGELTVATGNDRLLPGDRITALAVDQASRLLLTGASDGQISAWDLDSGEWVGRFAGHSAFVHELALSPDGQLLLSASDDRKVVLWDMASGQPRFTYTHPTDAITAVAFSPDGVRFAAGIGTTRYVADFDTTSARDTRILLWDTATGNEVGQLVGHTGPVTTVAFSADGRYLLSGGFDSAVYLWEVSSGQLVRRFDGHAGGVMSVAFSPDGHHGASGAQDGTVIVWDLGSGDALRQFTGHEGVVHHVAFTPDSQALWSAAEDGRIHRWALLLDSTLDTWIATHRHLQPLTCLQRQQIGLGGDCAGDS